MTIIIIIFGLLYIAIGTIVLIGVTLHDINEALWLRAFRRHPYALRYRKRPQIFLDHQATNEQFDKMRRYYRNLSQTNMQADYILRIPSGSQLSDGLLQNAVKHLNTQNKIHIYELPTILVPTITVHDLLCNYRFIAADLFRKSRAGLGTPSTVNAVILRNVTITLTKKHIIYKALGAAIHVSLPFALVATTYTGIVLGISEILLIALGGYCLFMIAAIWWHDQLSFKQKLGYALLSPITLWYFAGVSIEQSLKILAHVSKAIFHSSVSLFVRVKDILRIV